MRRISAATWTRTFGIALATGVLSGLTGAVPAGAALATDATAATSATVSDSLYTRQQAVGHLRSRAYARTSKPTARLGTSVPAPSTAVVPAGAIHVPPGQDLSALVAAHPEGSAFLLLSGVHRLQGVAPKDGNTFVGQPGAVLNGARLLSEFTESGGAWYADGQTQESYVQGYCRAATPLCNRPDRVYVDDVPLTPVATRAELRPDTYFFDYAADRIWLGGDPTARRVEAAARWAAFGGTATGVTIRSLVVEKYATSAQRGAIDVRDGRNWLIENVTARLNGSAGVRAGEGTTIRNSTIVDNGQIGIVGAGSGILVEDTEIARNNTAGFDAGWEAGGAKFVITEGLVVRGNSVHHNDGPGLWTDIDTLNTTYLNNVVEDNNGLAGILHEISGSAVIRGNTVRRNGLKWNPWVWGAGIHVASSSDVEVYDNLVEDNGNGIVGSQQNRGSGRIGPWLLRNLHVHDNVIRNSGRVGVAQDVGDPSIFTSRGIRYDANSYAPGQVFSWMDQDMNGTKWQSYGLDLRGVGL